MNNVTNNNDHPAGQDEVDISNCRVRKISDNLMDCLVEKNCGYALPFGDGKFCRHPLKHQIPTVHNGKK